MSDGLTVRKEIEVGRGVDDAFRLFTEGIASWWPTGTHSLGGDRVVDVRFGSAVGELIFEVLDDGTETPWGEILAWDPPRRVRVRWGVSSGRPPTTWEATFEPVGDRTRVVLEHWGWEALGDEAAEAHASYDGGWEPVLGAYRAAT